MKDYYRARRRKRLTATVAVRKAQRRPHGSTMFCFTMETGVASDGKRIGQGPHHGGAAASSAGDTAEDPVPAQPGGAQKNRVIVIYHFRLINALTLDLTNVEVHMGLKKLMARLLRPKWMGTPEMFLAVVMEMSLRNNPDYSTRELLQLGEVMQKLVRIDLSPYKDFADLVERGVPDESIVENLKKNEKEVYQRRDLKQAIYGPEADLGDDDVLKSNSEGAVFARKMVKNMSAYVEFPEEEQRKIDDLDKR